MEDITYEQIAARSDTLMQIDPGHTYQISYPRFRSYFEGFDQLTMEHLINGSNMVYGWMPTILKYKSRSFDEALEILNEVKNGELLNDEQIVLLKELFNNSYVGTSKILHFVNPANYAIWDSKVFKFLENYRERATENHIMNFSPYLTLCRRIISDPRFADLQPGFEDYLGYPVSQMRKVELIMFTNYGAPLD